MKSFEVTYDGEKIIVRREAEERLTAEQKRDVLVTLVCCLSLLEALRLVGPVSFLAAAGFLLMFGLYHMLKY